MSPVTTIGEVAPVLVPGAPVPDVHVARRPVIGLPFAAGTAKATVIWLNPDVTVGWAGGSGVPTTTEFETGDSGPVPSALNASTVHV